MMTDPQHVTQITTAWQYTLNAIKAARADGLAVCMKYPRRVAEDGTLAEDHLICSIARVLK